MSDRTAVNQGPTNGDAYPFASAGPAGLLDCHVSYADPSCRFRLPLRLEVSGQDRVVTDADGETVLAVTLSEGGSRAWGSRTVRQWYGEDFTLRTVERDPADGVGDLDPRTWYRTPDRVTSLGVGAYVLTGPVSFEAGYNVSLAPAEAVSADGGRRRDVLRLDAVPGAGDGRQPGCEEAEVVVRRINGIGPDDDGNFSIKADDCLRVQLAVAVDEGGPVPTASYAYGEMSAEESAAALVVFADCKPCYACEYFARTYKGLSRVWDRWQAAATDAEGVRDSYAANKSRWEAQKACREQNPVRLVVVPEAGCKAFVGGSVCNVSECCATGATLSFAVTPEAVVLEAYAVTAAGEQRVVPAAGDGGEIVFSFSGVEPNGSAAVRMRVSVPCEAGTPVVVTVTGSVTHAGTAPGGGPCSSGPVSGSETRAVPSDPTPASYECGS